MVVARDRATHSGSTATAAAEAYRVLRSSVKFAEGATTRRTVLVVDVDRAEPSGVARELAAAFARAGDTCVFVDLAAVPGDEPGFAALLAGNSSATSVGEPTDVPNLTRVSPGADFQPDLLASSTLADVFATLHESYAYVIVSCVGLPARGDALALAPRADGVILVVTSGKTRRPRAIAARDQLERVGANLLGVVLLETKRRLFW